MLGDVVGLDDPQAYVASGGTEADSQALTAPRNLADGNVSVAAPESPHFGFRKAADAAADDFQAVRDDDWRVSRAEADERRVVCMSHVARDALASFVSDLAAVNTV